MIPGARWGQRRWSGQSAIISPHNWIAPPPRLIPQQTREGQVHEPSGARSRPAPAPPRQAPQAYACRYDAYEKRVCSPEQYGCSGDGSGQWRCRWDGPVVAQTGLRPEEAYGMHVGDIDLGVKTIRIERAVSLRRWIIMPSGFPAENSCL